MTMRGFLPFKWPTSHLDESHISSLNKFEIVLFYIMAAQRNLKLYQFDAYYRAAEDKNRLLFPFIFLWENFFLI